MTLEINKIHCVDFVDGIRLIADSSVDLVVTDPPYGMSFVSNHRSDKHKAISLDDSTYWFPYLIHHLHRVLKENTHAYIFCSHHNLPYFQSECAKKFTVKSILVWEKNNTGMGDLKADYAPQCEFILFLQKGRRELNGRRDSNILKFARTDNELHPTQKPVDLLAYIIEKSSDVGQLVFDPFMGSGSTAVACQHKIRDFIGFELDESYCEKANLRLTQKNILCFGEAPR